ncbi:MAG: GNAT family N-acetyltransferase [Parvularculaceae bacterium]
MTIQLATDRLILRALAPEDAEAHIAMMGDPDIAATLTLAGEVESRHRRWRAFAAMLGHWQIRGFGMFSVIERESDEWVGRVGPWMPESWPGLECGWGIARMHWGKGYAPEAAEAAIRWIFDQKPALDRIISLISPANPNSQAVAAKIGEKKTGETFTYENLTLDIWAADRNEWLNRFGA